MITGTYCEYLLRQGYRKLTVRGTRNALGLYEGYVRDNFHKKITEVTTEEIESYISYLMENIGRETTLVKTSILRGFYKYCRKEGLMLDNPADRIEIYLHHDRMPKYVPDEKTIDELLAQPMETDSEGIRDKAIMELLYSSGLRRNEVIDLKMGDIDTKEGVVIVRNGKGGRGRIVPAGKTACACVERYLEEARPKRTKSAEEVHLFVTERGDRLKDHTVNELFKRYRIRMESAGRITPHSLRHACAIGMLRGGASISVIQEMLGHRQLTTTQVYTRLYPADIKRIHAKAHPREKSAAKILAKSGDISENSVIR